MEDLKNVSFGDLITVRNTVGKKKFDSYYKKAVEAEIDSEESVQESENEFEEKDSKEITKPIGSKNMLSKRADKNMPTEISSKKPVTRRRKIVDSAKPKFRDPRFEPLSGKLNTDLFKRSYGFIEEYEEKEIIKLKEEISKEKDADKKFEMKKKLSVMTSRLRARQQKEKLQSAKRDWKKKELKLVEQGKKPFFLKKSEVKKNELIDQYNKIGKGANMEKFLEKRRKKNYAKEHKSMPRVRRSA